MTFVALNPTWTVPPANLAEDIAPTLKADPRYLEKRGLIRSGAQFRPCGERHRVRLDDGVVVGLPSHQARRARQCAPRGQVRYG